MQNVIDENVVFSISNLIEEYIHIKKVWLSFKSFDYIERKKELEFIFKNLNIDINKIVDIIE